MDIVKSLVVEAFGVFSLVYIGGLGVWLTSLAGGSLTSVGLTHGIILGFVIIVGGPISGGQYNPAVTLALLLTGDIAVIKGLMYMVAQSAGSLLAAVTLTAVKPAIIADSMSLGFPELNPKVSEIQGFILEFTATFFLVLAVYTGIRTNQNERTIALYVGGILLCFIQAIGGLTGAALNPCRVLGPAIVTGKIFSRGGWVYYPATLLGGAAAGFFSSLFLHSDQSIKTNDVDESKEGNDLSQEMTM